LTPELLRTVTAFLKLAEERFGKVSEALAAGSGNIRPLIRREELTRHVVESLESSNEYKELISAVRSLSDADKKAPDRPVFDTTDRDVGTYLRKSGFYLGLAAGESPQPDGIASGLRSAFTESSTYTAHFYAPLGYTYLETPVLRCPGFEIRQYSHQELDELLNSDIVRTFNPKAEIDVSDLVEHNILHCWAELASPPQLSKDFLEEIGQPQTLSSVADPLHNPLRLIALLNWLPERSSDTENPDLSLEGPMLWPVIPYWIGRDDSPFSIPNAPDRGATKIGDFIEYDGTFHYQGFLFDEGISRGIENRMQVLSRQLLSIKGVGKPWRFVFTSVDFLVEAMLSAAVQRLLWGFVAIEALLGERNPPGGLEAAIGRRLANLLGRTKKERKDLRRNFSNLYDLRSRIMHGDQSPKEPLPDDLFLAERPIWLARAACCNLIKILGEVSPSFEGTSSKPPSRQEILRLLDTRNWAGMRDFLNSLPSNSPLF